MIVEAGLVPDLVGALRSEYEHQANMQTRKFPIRASALGDCPRKLAQLLRHVESDKPSDRAMRIFEIGNSRGEYLARAAVAQVEAPSRAVLEGEVYIPTMVTGSQARAVLGKALAEWDDHGLLINDDGVLCIRGRYDLAIFHESGLVDVIDFKTAADYGFKQAVLNEPQGRYLIQLLSYGAGLEQQGYTVNSLQLVYENKNTCELAAKEVAYSEANIGLLNDRLAMASGILTEWARGVVLDEHAPPAYAEGVTGNLPWQCNYCNIGPVRGRCTEGREVVDSPTARGGPHRWVVR